MNGWGSEVQGVMVGWGLGSDDSVVWFRSMRTDNGGVGFRDTEW